MITYPNVKLNLGLNVLRRRPDGYHDLETLFVPYTGLHDTLEIISGDDFSRTLSSLVHNYSDGEQGLPENRATLGIVRGRGPATAGRGPAEQDVLGETLLSGSDVPSAGKILQAIRGDGKVMVTIARAEGVDWDPLKDLTVKAYEVLEQDFKLPPVKICLEKTSPVGAGLGGGSADAAFALRMMSEMFNLGLDDASLAAYAARLGSDCAFFIYNRPMFGSGRGEILDPYEIDLSAYDVRVSIPAGVAVSTADAYRGITPREPEVPLREVLARPVSQWRGSLVNDFEATVFAKYPSIAAAKERLYTDGALYASMSGSGSALFGIFRR